MNRLAICLGLGLLLITAHLAPDIPRLVDFALGAAYLAVVPGLTVEPHARLSGALSRWLLIVAVSLGTATVVSELLAVFGIWRWWAVIAVLALLAVATTALGRPRPRHSRET